MPLIGFSGSPWTLATYMVEGKGGTDFLNTKKMAYARPDLLHHILETNAQTVIQYLNAQIAAGAQAVMIFDSWGGALSHNAYIEFSLNYMQKIVAGLTKTSDGKKVPSIVFTKGGALWLEAQQTLVQMRWGWIGQWILAKRVNVWVIKWLCKVIWTRDFAFHTSSD